MKATLEFSLPDEKDEFTNALNGHALVCDLEEFERWLHWQWDEAEHSDEVKAFVNECWERYRAAIQTG